MSGNENAKVNTANIEGLLSTLNKGQSIKEATSERDKLTDSFYREERGSKLGLINIWAYHCNRCNHTWLPKDFDLDRAEAHSHKKGGNKKIGKWAIEGQDLFFRQPPKSCARCKSKSWKNFSLKRRSKSAIVDEDGWIEEPTSWERWRMLVRRGQSLEAAHLRPDSIEILLKHKVLKKFKKDGKQYIIDARGHYLKVKKDGGQYITDGKMYLKEPEPEPEQVKEVQRS